MQYSIVTIVTMLYIRSPELIHLITGSLYPLTFHLSPVLPPALVTTVFTLCFYEFGFFRFHIQVITYNIVFLYLTYGGLFLDLSVLVFPSEKWGEWYQPHRVFGLVAERMV